MQQTIHLEM